MSSVKFQKGSPEWYMFQDYWKLCQKFWIPEKNDNYWDNMVNETREFMKKYEDIALASGLAIALIDDLENRMKQEYK